MKIGATSSRAASFPRVISEFEAMVVGFMLLPILVHAFPVWGDEPAAARFLPIFYAPLLAALHYRAGWAFGLAALTPWVSHLLTGRPLPGITVLLTIELVIFVALLLLMVKRLGAHWWMGPAAYLLTKPFSGVVLLVFPELLIGFSYGAHLVSAVTRSWPGLIVLALLGYVAVRLKERERKRLEDEAHG